MPRKLVIEMEIDIDGGRFEPTEHYDTKDRVRIDCFAAIAVMFAQGSSYDKIASGDTTLDSFLGVSMRLVEHPQESKIAPLQAIIDENLHQRECQNCGNVAYHKDSIIPYVLCGKCGSQDTRRIREKHNEM